MNLSLISNILVSLRKFVHSASMCKYSKNATKSSYGNSYDLTILDLTLSYTYLFASQIIIVVLPEF